MRRIKSNCIFLLSIFASIILEGCIDHKEARSILPEETELRPGDVVLRRGSGVTSRVVLMADQNGAYSHVGIVVDSAGTPMIAHAVPDEPDYEGDPDRVKMEAPESFFSSIHADIGCVMRCSDSKKAQEASEVAKRFYHKRTLFDHDYNDADTTKMYCCELVEYAYASVGMPIAPPVRHILNLPGLDIDSVMLPSDFRDSKKVKVVVEFCG